MISLTLQTTLAILTAHASGLIVDVVQGVQGAAGPSNLPTLRLCRPLINQSPVAIDPLKTTCPDGSSVFWLWNYNSQPSDKTQSLLNLLGVTSNSRETPYLLSQVDYNTVFSYGFTNPGLRYQPSAFKVKRDGVYQTIDSNNQLRVNDELEYFSPVLNENVDKTLRIQSQGKSPPYLMRQLTDANGNVILDTTYPTATLRVNSLGNTELVLPRGNWLQRGAQGLTNVANTVKSGFNTFVAKPLANTATYISQNSPQWRENAKTWLGQTGGNLYNGAGALVNNGVNYISRPLANAGNWVENKLANGVDRLGNALNSGVDYITAPLAAGGEWVETKLANGVDRLGNAVNNGVDYITAPLVEGGEWVERTANNYVAKPLAQAGAWVGNTATNAYNTARQDLTGVGGAIGQGWQSAKDFANEGLDAAGGWARGQINNGLQRVDKWVNGGVPMLQTVGGMAQPVQSAIPVLGQYQQAQPVPSGMPVAGQVNNNALPVVAPQGLGGSTVGVLGANGGVPSVMRTGGGLPVNGNLPWGQGANQYFVPGQAKA
ncbi:hypothetical protein TWF281_002177 [Arthrobotrys megalospora]